MSKAPPLFLYLHIPKTGGSTLGSILYAQYHDGTYSKAEGGYLHAAVYYLPDGFIRPASDQIPRDQINAMRRSDVNAVLGHFAYGLHEALGRPARYMTILREPVRRVLSLYNHLAAYGQLPADMTVEDFVTGPYLAEACNDQVRRVAGCEPGIACNRTHLETAKHNLAHAIEFTGITERFDTCMLLAGRTFGWTESINYLPRLVNTTKSDAANHSHAVLDMVREYNQFDMELYAFANQLLDERIAAQGPAFQAELETYIAANQKLLSEHGPASTVS
ncbi:sulfotransferase family protein [Planctomycetales bacterium ZRK34]|nr:sulfotransferase family protein [Planctomycetales bacterium ZRK34]